MNSKRLPPEMPCASPAPPAARQSRDAIARGPLHPLDLAACEAASRPRPTQKIHTPPVGCRTALAYGTRAYRVKKGQGLYPQTLAIWQTKRGHHTRRTINFTGLPLPCLPNHGVQGPSPGGGRGGKAPRLPSPNHHGHERGFALLLVLWAMVLLALLATQVTAGGRGEMRLSAALVAQAQLQSAVDAAVYETIWHLVAGSDPWGPEVGRVQMAEHGIDVSVTILDERGKLDLNAVPGDLAASFFAVLGADRSTAQDLADRIAEWRTGQLPQDDAGRVRKIQPAAPSAWGPPGHDLQLLEDLRLIPGMTDPLYRAILPHAVLHLGQAPLYRVADPVVRAALDQNKRETHVTQADPDPREGYLVRVVATATHAGDAFTRSVELHVAGIFGNGARYRIFSWN